MGTSGLTGTWEGVVSLVETHLEGYAPEVQTIAKQILLERLNLKN